ncbi:hypothetical protein JNUCC31_19175 [Paenibacillus sp. JNUCC31]|uniref:hypothetical protein n=1 Tax=Paenibacillus sp. JNUCC-31 TaxID=2777983 RepID=UPI001781C370|nr:hypothetical protein [Paenibacillus sp. JNUCC-31]QOS76947.1 hypothetical protein JNUCC31_19175 [Paenibacillus sp. JNUCC-31]
MIKKWKKLTLVASLAVLWNVYPIQAVQAEQLKVSGNTLHEWNNGAKVDASVDNKGSIQIKTSTQGLKKGNYSAYVYELQNRDWSGYGALTFSIRNESDQKLPLNIVLTRSDKLSLTVSDNRNVIVVEKATGQAELVRPVSGLIELEPGFVGQIRIPFSSLMVKNKANTTGQVSLGKVIGWGITTTTPENAKLSFRIGNIKPLSRKQAVAENGLTTLQMTGDERVVKPVTGESTVQYGVQSALEETPDVKFQLDTPVQGVSITPDGLLTVHTDADAERATIRALVNGKWRLTTIVILDRSSAMNVQENDGTPRSIPDPSEGTKVLSPADPLMKTSVGWFIWLLLTAAGIHGLILYWLWKRQRKASGAIKRRSREDRQARRPFRM